jgi:oligopeptide/dipeptide ABC transporter ATP-binding protein
MAAIAMSCEPSLIIADEPTTALDVTIQAQFLDLMKSVRTAGMGILFITHDLGVVAELCDRVAVMYAGQIVESGSVNEIFKEPHHPYTAALIASVPASERTRAALPDCGSPDPTNLPRLPLAPRCARPPQSVLQILV